MQHTQNKAVQALKLFLWFAFAAFLLSSVSHIAYFYRSHEPFATGVEDTWLWIQSYAKAIGIDVANFLMSMVVSGLMRQKASRSLVLSLWCGIILVTLYSFSMNWEYSVENANTMLSHVDTLALFQFSFKDINPVLAGGFQFVALAFTWIADKVSANEQVRSAADLEAEANEAEARRKQEKRLEALRNDKNESRVDGLFAFAGKVKKQWKSTIHQDTPKTGETEQPSSISPSESQAPEHGGEREVTTPSNVVPQGQKPKEKITDKLPVTPSSSPVPSWSKGKKTGYWIDSDGQQWLVREDAKNYYALKGVLLDSVRTDSIQSLVQRYPTHFNAVMQGRNLIPVVRRHALKKDMATLKEILERLYIQAKSANVDESKRTDGSTPLEVESAIAAD